MINRKYIAEGFTLGHITENEMNDAHNTQVALYCTSGIVQYAHSIEAMLGEYNRDGAAYATRIDTEGNIVMWHKGHRRTCGVFKSCD